MSQRRRVALVTGAGRNIGRAVAPDLARDGLDVAVNGSADREACESVAREARALGAQALVAMGDVGRAEDCARIAGEAIARFGAVDVLVNNAVLRPARPFLEATEEEWRRVMAVDLDAAVWLARACLPGMLERGWGRVVNMSSITAELGAYAQSSYATSKAALLGLTRTLALEGARHGITANAIVPGIIGTEAFHFGNPDMNARITKRTAMKRPGEPQDIANAIAFLCSDLASYITGVGLNVSGGIELFTF